MNRDRMDPLGFLSDDELTRFFHCKKTEMSCMENPTTFLNQLRDHNLLPEDQYKKVIEIKSKSRMQEGVYQMLDRLEKEGRQRVRLFWICVFENHILQIYPVFRSLRNSLLDGSFKVYEQFPDAEELSKKEPDSSQSKQQRADGQMCGRKRKKNTEETKKRKEPCSSSCSNRDQKEPAEEGFKKGKGNSRSWTQGIGCLNTSLQTSIEGHLQSSSKDGETADSSAFSSFALAVSCGSLSGVLYKGRFAAGSRSKSIRTEECWFTPEDFLKQEITLTDGHWDKDILCHGKTLDHLVKKDILYVHPQECQCRLCCPDNPLDQDNDDVCFVCNSAGNLVCCDECPRAFHHQCHLPVLQERTLGSKWMCTFCVLKANQELWIDLTSEAALNSPVSGNIMRCEYLLLCLYKEDARCVFTCDPTATVLGYTRVISKPMWLEQVKSKLQNREYETVREFVGDIRLIFQNCRRFNKNNEFGKMGARLHEIFEREFHTIFKIV